VSQGDFRVLYLSLPTFCILIRSASVHGPPDKKKKQFEKEKKKRKINVLPLGRTFMCRLEAAHAECLFLAFHWFPYSS
jgi:hypothetical protein